MPEYTLEKIVAAVLVVVLFIILALIMIALKVGGGFFYVGCEGEIEGSCCSGSINSQGDNITVSECGTEIKAFRAIDNPRCSIYKTYDQCILRSYAPIKQEDKNVSVCLWVENPANAGGKNCLLNAELSCDDFTQTTVPKCGDVPGCRGVSAIKRGVEEIAPEKCTVGLGSTCII